MTRCACAAWRWIEPILAGWEQDPAPPRPYTAGTWGPAASSALVGRDGLAWPQDNGPRKRAVIESAAARGDHLRQPIATLLRQHSTPMQVFFSASE